MLDFLLSKIQLKRLLFLYLMNFFVVSWKRVFSCKGLSAQFTRKFLPAKIINPIARFTVRSTIHWTVFFFNKINISVARIRPFWVGWSNKSPTDGRKVVIIRPSSSRRRFRGRFNERSEIGGGGGIWWKWVDCRFQGHIMREAVELLGGGLERFALRLSWRCHRSRRLKECTWGVCTDLIIDWRWCLQRTIHLYCRSVIKFINNKTAEMDYIYIKSQAALGLDD